MGADRLTDDGGGDCTNSVIATAASKRASSCRLLASSGVEEAICLRATSSGLVPSDEEASDGKSPLCGDALVTGDTPNVNGLLLLLSLAGDPRFRKAKLCAAPQCSEGG